MKKLNMNCRTMLLILSMAMWLPSWAADPPYRLLENDTLTFSGGAIDSQDGDIYMINMGNYTQDATYQVTVTRPRGAEANYPVSIDYELVNGSMGWRFTASGGTSNESLGRTLTFEPGETSKTITISTISNVKSDPDSYPLMVSGSGTAYLFFSRGNRTTAPCSVIQMNFTNPNSITIPPVASADEMIAIPDLGRQGNTVNYRFMTATYSDSNRDPRYSIVTADQKLVFTTLKVNHDVLSIDDSDMDNAVPEQHSLSPREVGSTSQIVTFLYKLTDDEIVSDYIDGWSIFTPEPNYPFTYDRIEHIKQAGAQSPNDEVTLDIAEFGYQHNDLPANSYYFSPRFGAVSTDKTEYNGGEVVQVNISFLNWKVFKKVFQSAWLDNIMLTIDNGATFITSNRTFDEATGTLSFRLNAPTVSGSADSTIYAEIVMRSPDDNDRLIYPYSIYAPVTIKTEVAAAVFTDSIAVSGLPEQNKIFREKKSTYQLGYTVYPDNSSFLNAVWSSSDTTILSVSTSGLLTAKKSGSATLTLTSDEVAYRQQNSMPDNNEILVKTFAINVTDSLPKLAGAMGWYAMDDSVVTDFYYNMKNRWTVKDNKVTFTLTYANQIVKTMEQTIDPSTGTIAFTVPFGDDSPKTPSLTTGGKYIPTCSVQASLVLIDTDGMAYNVSAVSDIYIRHPLMQVNLLSPFKILAYTGVARTDSLEILNLIPGDYTITYTLNNNYDPTSPPDITYTAGAGPVPDWLEITNDGLHDRALIKATYMAENPAAHNSTSLSYGITLRAKNSAGDNIARSFGLSSVNGVSADDAVLSFTKERADGRYTYEPIAAFPKDNQADLAAFADIMSQVRAGTMVGNAIEALNNMRANNIQTFNVNFPEEWGDMTITISGKAMSDTVPPVTYTYHSGENRSYYTPTGTAVSVDFNVGYPTDGLAYTTTLTWPDVNVTKEIIYTNYSPTIDNEHIYSFFLNMYGKEAPGETFTLEYITTDSIIHEKPMRADGYVFFYEPDSVLTAHILSSNLRRPPSELYGVAGLGMPVEGGLKKSREIKDGFYFSNWYGRDGLEFIPNAAIYNKSYGAYMAMNGAELADEWGSIYYHLFDVSGNPITNARINYVVLDTLRVSTGVYGTISAATDKGFEIPMAITLDDWRKALVIEIIADGFAPQIVQYDQPLYGLNHSPYFRSKSWYTYGRDSRDFNVVLRKAEDVFYNVELVVPESDTSIPTYDLSGLPLSSITPYTENFDKYHHVRYNLGKPVQGFGVSLYASFACDSIDDPKQLVLGGKNANWTKNPSYYTRLSKADFPGFEHSYLLDLGFDLYYFLPGKTETYPYIKYGNKMIGQLPGLRNSDANAKDIAKDLALSIPTSSLGVPQIDNNSKANGGDFLDSSSAFDKFDITLPSGLPFTFNVSKSYDRYTITGMLAVNFIPGGQVMDLAESANDLYKLYQDCMSAVNGKYYNNSNSSVPFNSAFAGIRGYISAIGYYNPETDQIDVTILGGGISVEASASVKSGCNFGIGSFGVGLSAKLATAVQFINRSAATGNLNSRIKMDVILDTEVSLRLWAWVEAGIELYFVGASVGIEGGASIDHTQRAVFPTYGGRNDAGFQTKLHAYLKSYARWHFLWWSWGDDWTIFDFQKNFLTPNSASNPFSSSYIGPKPVMMSSSSNRLISAVYQPARLRSLSLSDAPIIENVSSSASPHYLFDGNSLAYLNIKAPADNNDDRLQLYTAGSSTDLVPATTPSFAFDAASSGNQAVVAYEQLSESILESDLTDFSNEAAMKMMAPKMNVVAATNNGGVWKADTLSNNAQSNMSPRTAIQKVDGHASVIWSSGQAVVDTTNQYMNGELLFSRYNGTNWSQPLRLLGLDKDYVFTNYSLSMDNDTTFIAATRRRGIGANAAPNDIIFISVTPDNKVDVIETGMKGQNPQLKRIGSTNLLAFTTTTADSLQDVRLITVDGSGRPAGTLNGFAGLSDRTVQNLKIAVADNATDLDGVSLLWNEAVQMTDPSDPETFKLETGLYAAKLGRQDNRLYSSVPVKVMTVPDGYKPMSYDAYLNGLTVKAATALANENLGADIVENTASFENSVTCTNLSYPMTDITPGNEIKVLLDVRNDGYQPITSIDVTIAGDPRTTTTAVNILPGQTATVESPYKVLDDFNGTIDYDIAAVFSPANTSLRSTALRAAGQTVTTNGSRNANLVNMGLRILSNISDDTDTHLLLNVSDLSSFPLKAGYDVTVEMYKENEDGTKVTYPGTSLQTIPASKFDTTQVSGRTNVVVPFKVANVTSQQIAYVKVTTMNGTNEILDTDGTNNVVPILLFPPVKAIVLYNVNVGTYTNGSIQTDKTSAGEDETVTLTITPAVGYVIDSLWVVDTSDSLTVVPLQQITDSTRTFTMPAFDVTVKATFKSTVIPTYNVNIGTYSGGSIQADKASAAKDETVTLTIYPATGYELESISVVNTNDEKTVINLQGTGNSRTFTMPAYDVTIKATFKIIQEPQDPDKEAVEAMKAIIEAGNYRIAQEDGNDEASVRAWLANMLNVPEGSISIVSLTPAVAGTEGNPTGTNGSFTFTVALTKGNATLTTNEVLGVIAATVFTPVKDVKISLDNLTISIRNTGNASTGNLTFALSGANADVFILPATTINSLAAGEEMNFTIALRTDLPAGSYTATLTVSAEGMTPVTITISYTQLPTDVDTISNEKVLKAWIQDYLLYISGLTEGNVWSVYSASGILIRRDIAGSSETSVALSARGVYVVKSNGQIVKVMY